MNIDLLTTTRSIIGMDVCGKKGYQNITRIQTAMYGEHTIRIGKQAR